MHRTLHEAAELRDLIVECGTIANKLLHAVSTCRDASARQMLGAHERVFRQHCHQLKQMLAGQGGYYGLASAPAGHGAGVPAAGGGQHGPALGATPAGGTGPAGMGPAGAAGYPATGPGSYGYRPMRGGAPGPERRSDNTEDRGAAGRAVHETRDAVRSDRPELAGWEPGAGNNEGWQAAARRDAREGQPEAFTAVRPVGDAYSPGRGPEPAGFRGPGTTQGEASGFRGHWTAQDGPASFAGQGSAPGGPAGRAEASSPRVELAQAFEPALRPGTAGAAGTAGHPGTTGYPGTMTPGTAGYTGAAGHPGTAAYPGTAMIGTAVTTGTAGEVQVADPDALAIADCMKDCKHMAVRLVMAATECADRHLRRTLYQMAGQHLEMAEQHFHWLERRNLYTVPGADPETIRGLEQEIQRLEQAVRVGPAAGAAHEPRRSPDGHGGAVNTDTAYYPSGGLKGEFGGQAIRN